MSATCRRVVCTVFHLFRAGFEAHFSDSMCEMDADKKKTLKEDLLVRIAKVAATIEKLFYDKSKANNVTAGNGWFVGTTPTFADIFAVGFYELADSLVRPG
ncbi:hypothetical protein BV898_12586 [Hypsibius exemplaris]|uniref:Glutathione S-transferase C-terminal domain-containing protein n=1 Tax=Hypsibius exemplaris TaxID=2072580 RepID=A0A1W0WD59_HYPEX|nr:hypothetical protein BV898_12586 [Hypsibius exemplaris]